VEGNGLLQEHLMLQRWKLPLHHLVLCLICSNCNFYAVAGQKYLGMRPQEGRSIYLDVQATTPMDPRVLDAMLPLMVESFGNPHSRTHDYGREAANLVEEARQV
jgi:hypothetical protein